MFVGQQEVGAKNSLADSQAPGAATVIRMQIQPRNRFRWSQQHRQLQLCVPLVTTTSAWWTRRSIMHVVGYC